MGVAKKRASQGGGRKQFQPIGRLENPTGMQGARMNTGEQVLDAKGERA